jgi:DNA-binding phage protein
MGQHELTVPFDQIVEERIAREPALAVGLLEEAAQCLLNGELGVARNLVRNVIKGSIGYAELSRRTGTPETSLIRMFGPKGNPTAENLSAVFAQLQRAGGVKLQVSAAASTRSRAVSRSTRASRRVA